MKKVNVDGLPRGVNILNNVVILESSAGYAEYMYQGMWVLHTNIYIYIYIYISVPTTNFTIKILNKLDHFTHFYRSVEKKLFF